MTKATQPTTVTVTGAAGQIGYALLFRIASGAMLGPDVPVRLRLLEITPALRAAEGTAMELDDCAFPLLAGMDITDDPKTAFDGSSVCHSASQYPDLYHARAFGRSVAEQVDQAWLRDTFLPTVAQRGAAIIDARGASSAASAANAAIDHMRSWVHGTPDGDWVSAAVVSDGSYGCPRASFPGSRSPHRMGHSGSCPD